MELACTVLRDLGCTLALREEICQLVRYHGRPPYLLEKSDPAKEVIGLSWTVSNQLLYLFARADTRGRETAEMNRPEDNLHLWKLMADENDCFDQPYAFAYEQARFLFYRGELSSLHYTPREDYSCNVTPKGAFSPFAEFAKDGHNRSLRDNLGKWTNLHRLRTPKLIQDETSLGSANDGL
ncbi:hypothetical protein BH11PLA2_BH11PLA2_48960 [soil metagenome]